MTEVKRRYTSAVRDEAARHTRRAIVAAAVELFVERGYAGTSLADIATAAGVARPTVFAAFGSKPALLRRVVDEAMAGDDEPVAIADRPWFRPVWDATTPDGVLDAYADVCLVLDRRAARLFEAVRRAADDSPDVAELWRSLQHNRRVGATMIVERIRELGATIDGERAVDILWIFNDPGHYAALVDGCGWAEEEYRDWLAKTMRAALLRDGGAPSVRATPRRPARRPRA